MGASYPNGNGTALSGLLSGQRVGLSEGGTPVSTTDRENGELGNDNGSTDGSSDFLRGLDTETNVTLGVTDNDDGLKAGTLTGTGLLLDGLDLDVGDGISHVQAKRILVEHLNNETEVMNELLNYRNYKFSRNHSSPELLAQKLRNSVRFSPS